MSYSILRLIDLLGDTFPSLLNSVLKRLPIIVTGNDPELVDDLVESVAKLVPHRHRIVFWRDFTSEDEILSVWEEERHNYEVNRTVVCSLSSNLRLALERNSNFSGWIVGVARSDKSGTLYAGDSEIQNIITQIAKPNGSYGYLQLISPSSMSFTLFSDVRSEPVVERKIVSKILTRKTQSLERIRRLLGKSLKGAKMSEDTIHVVLNLDDEAEIITQDMFEEEISNFVHAARRAVTLLSRIRLARELGASTVLTERNLCEAIGWDGGALEELVRFINAEWHEDFSDCVRMGTLSGLGAWVDSMWGA